MCFGMYTRSTALVFERLLLRDLHSRGCSSNGKSNKHLFHGSSVSSQHAYGVVGGVGKRIIPPKEKANPYRLNFLSWKGRS